MTAVLHWARRHELLPTNPMDHVTRLHREPHVPDALTTVEVNKIRVAISAWEAGFGYTSGPRPDGQLGCIVEVMLGTSAGIGEVLGIRRLDVTSDVPFIHLAGTIISRKGELTFRQITRRPPLRGADHGKRAASSAQGSWRSGRRWGDAAPVPPHGRDRGRRQRERRAGAGVASPHGHKDHAAALHPA
ncbi:hypothetical protein E3T35_07730 [Cryobacterium sp. TMT1-2-2]|uniref:hypothetical protein n=1 Tax=Cryobacterium sp. TMT1-2-2 TaxID=1259233 RepID=UPI00106C6892|nr:hypothetical protein [Cryobacterium sp. TMT1-2-2]TFD12228.1 hypothetical protein E3T35_07730 [Cryobacterium sp. TMT1-2-2]